MSWAEVTTLIGLLEHAGSFRPSSPLDRIVGTLNWYAVNESADSAEGRNDQLGPNGVPAMARVQQPAGPAMLPAGQPAAGRGRERGAEAPRCVAPVLERGSGAARPQPRDHPRARERRRGPDGRRGDLRDAAGEDAGRHRHRNEDGPRGGLPRPERRPRQRQRRARSDAGNRRMAAQDTTRPASRQEPGCEPGSLRRTGLKAPKTKGCTEFSTSHSHRSGDQAAACAAARHSRNPQTRTTGRAADTRRPAPPASA